MRKLEISDTEVMSVAIRQEIERNDESRYDHRLHGVLLVANGMSARQAALWLSESERTVQRWVNRFEQIGFCGVQEAARSSETTQRCTLAAPGAGFAARSTGIRLCPDPVGWQIVGRAFAPALPG
jgi:hypothetical protein